MHNCFSASRGMSPSSFVDCSPSSSHVSTAVHIRGFDERCNHFRKLPPLDKEHLVIAIHGHVLNGVEFRERERGRHRGYSVSNLTVYGMHPSRDCSVSIMVFTRASTLRSSSESSQPYPSNPLYHPPSLTHGLSRSTYLA